MEYLDEIKAQLSLIDWASLTEETVELIKKLGDKNELLQDD